LDVLVGRIAIRLTAIMGLLAALLAFASVVAAQVVPYGGELAYVSYRGVNADIYLLDIARGQSFNLTHHYAYDAEPIWSPDGGQLAFVSDRDGPPGVYVMDASGGKLRRLTDSSGGFYHPAWSTDGKRIIFVSGAGQQQVIYSASADGGDLRQLTRDADGNSIVMDVGIERTVYGNTRSPDGQYLLDLRYDGGWYLVVMGNDPREPARVEPLGWFYTEPPIWSPDSHQIAYIRYQQDGANVYVLDLDSAQPRKLTDNRAESHSLTWRPRT
jgi:TolB protein